MGGGRKENETGQTKCLLNEVNRRLRQFKRNYKCSKRQLQLDVELFEKKGGRLEPRFRRGHKRILRYMNLQWKNPLLREALTLSKTDFPQLSSLLSTDGPEILTLKLKGYAEEEIGRNQIKINVDFSPKIIRTILSYGTDIEIVAPIELRNRFADVVRNLLDVYSQDPEVEEESNQESDLFNNIEETVEKNPGTVQTQPVYDSQSTVERQAVAQQKVENKHQAGEQLSMFDDLFN